MNNLPIEPGTRIAGKYRVEEVIGVGGMGAVVSARHAVLNQRVAIKLMRPELMENEEASGRFLREARAAARLQSDYVARVNDVELLDDGTPCMVMEYLEGRTLEDAIESDEELSVTWVVDHILEVLAGLAVAHSLGVVHRDLKPSNIFLARTPGARERAKILDFGLSKILEREVAEKRRQGQAGQLTHAKSLIGSPAYMSPEQILDPVDVDEKADIWAVGCIMHELFTKQLVFDEDDLNAIMLAILTEEVRPVSELRCDVPKGLAFVIWKCLSKDRRERFHSANELMRALAPYASPRARGAHFLADDQTFDDDFELAATVATASGLDHPLDDSAVAAIDGDKRSCSTLPPAATVSPPDEPAAKVIIPRVVPLLTDSNPAARAVVAAQQPLTVGTTGRHSMSWGVTFGVALLTAMVVAIGGWLMLGAPVMSSAPAAPTSQLGG